VCGPSARLAEIAIAERRKLSESTVVSTVTAHAHIASLQVPGVRRGALPAAPLRRLSTGIVPLDALLDGGLPRGYLSEIVGGPSSGRTTLLHALLASATRRGEVAAVIDLLDALDPPSLARTGVDLERVLWVRPPAPPSALRCAELILSGGGFGLVAVDLGSVGAGLRPAPTYAAWVRLAQVARRSAAAVVLCVPWRMTVSSAAVVLGLTRRRLHWSARLFDGVTTVAELTRSRFSPPERAVVLALGEQCAALDGVTVERLHPVWGGGGGAVARASMG
jgi:RecA DNA recombination protein